MPPRALRARGRGRSSADVVDAHAYLADPHPRQPLDLETYLVLEGAGHLGEVQPALDHHMQTDVGVRLVGIDLDPVHELVTKETHERRQPRTAQVDDPVG